MQDWSKRSALVVEDSTVQRVHLANLLKEAGFVDVREACDGLDALRVIEAHGNEQVFLVLTDLDMPGMDGIELIHHLALRQLTENLIVTSARDPRLLEVVESMGSDDASMRLLGTVLKPMRLGDLQLMLDRIGSVTRNNGAAQNGAMDSNLADLEAALKAAQFVPWFQPKIDVVTGLIKGVEALARWQHPLRGVLGPGHFITAMEGTPLMAPFTLSIVEQALANLHEWHSLGLSSLKVSVNLSADNLGDRGFIDRLAEFATRHNVPPASLIWEVTETMVMSNLGPSLANLARMSLKGYGLAMDDYGIGYSSVQQLSRCPFNELKIDRCFVHEAAQRPNRRVILESSIDMGRRLGITTVAEGVETVDDWKLLRELGCDLAQGFLIAKPMPASELVGWIKDNRNRLRSLAAA